MLDSSIDFRGCTLLSGTVQGTCKVADHGPQLKQQAEIKLNHHPFVTQYG
jgi:hypothetical protein